jgi:hypothetical protein
MIFLSDDVPGWVTALLVGLGVAVNAVAAWSTWAWYRAWRDRR